MVDETTSIHAPSGAIALQERLTCRDFGIYVANCRLCKEQYVGQTMNTFSIRWNQHRMQWNKRVTRNSNKHNDNVALRKHFEKFHREFILQNPDISECYSVIFVAKPEPHRLNFYEAKWHRTLNATINIQKMILPRI